MRGEAGGGGEGNSGNRGSSHTPRLRFMAAGSLPLVGAGVAASVYKGIGEMRTAVTVTALSVVLNAVTTPLMIWGCPALLIPRCGGGGGGGDSRRLSCLSPHPPHCTMAAFVNPQVGCSRCGSSHEFIFRGGNASAVGHADPKRWRGVCFLGGGAPAVRMLSACLLVSLTPPPPPPPPLRCPPEDITSQPQHAPPHHSNRGTHGGLWDAVFDGLSAFGPHTHWIRRRQPCRTGAGPQTRGDSVMSEASEASEASPPTRPSEPT